MKTIAKGAEGEIIQINKEILKKIRTSKRYRISIIDTKLRKLRNKREFKVLNLLYDNKVNVPKPYKLNEKEFYFTFEYLKGTELKKTLDKNNLTKAFDEIIKMHNLGIIHGDLTTLNMIENRKVYLIDFGLSQFSTKIEDRAVDLNLFFTCIKNEHPSFYKYKKSLLNKYIKKVDKGDLIIKRLENIELRGRNK